MSSSEAADSRILHIHNCLFAGTLEHRQDDKCSVMSKRADDVEIPLLQTHSTQLLYLWTDSPLTQEREGERGSRAPQIRAHPRKSAVISRGRLSLGPFKHNPPGTLSYSNVMSQLLATNSISKSPNLQNLFSASHCFFSNSKHTTTLNLSHERVRPHAQAREFRQACQ